MSTYQKTSGNPNMGRPRIEIDWKELDKLFYLQCTLVEIAGWFDCSEDTIELRVKEKHGITFTELSSKRSAKGKISIRRKQYQKAEEGNPTMLIWLGKQYLGQKDSYDIDQTVTARIEIDKTDEDL